MNNTSIPHTPVSAGCQTTDNPLDACIHCGFCLPACPTYQITGSEAESPRGRLYLMQTLLEPNNQTALQPDDIQPHLENCLGCLACQTACPSGVDYGSLLHQSRSKLLKRDSAEKNLKHWALKHLLPDPHRLRWLTHALNLYQAFGLEWMARHLIPLLGTPYRQLQAAVQLLPSIRSWQDKKPSLKPGQVFGNPKNPRVALFTGCIMNAWFQRIHWATIQVLVSQGYCVEIPDQTCCGALADHAGCMDIAAPLAHTNIQHLLNADVDYVVVNSAGCGSTLKAYPTHHNHTLGDEQAVVWQSRVIDVMELLLKNPLHTDTMISPFIQPQRVIYQAACHLRHAQGVTEIETTLLSQLPNVEVIPVMDSESCCGSAGTYNIEHPEMAQTILKNKMASLYHSTQGKFDWLLSANPGCLMQYELGLRQHTEFNVPKLAHPIELIAQYYPHIRLSSSFKP